MSDQTRPIPSGKTLPFRLTTSRPSVVWGVLVTALAVAIVAIGAVGFGVLALALFRASAVFGLIVATASLITTGFGLWILVKCVGEFRADRLVAPTVVEISAETLHPGQTVEILVAQPGPLRSKSWRVALVGKEHTLTWGTAPDPYNPQGATNQPYSKSRPLSVVEIGLRHDLTIPQGVEHRELWTFSIPADAIPQTWSSERSVTWGVEVQGNVNGWPKFTRVFPVAMVGEPVPSMS